MKNGLIAHLDIDVLAHQAQDWDLVLFTSPPKLVYMGRERRPDFVWYSQWETTRMLDDWLAPLNNCGMVFTASTFSRDVLKASGVTTKMVLVPHGVSDALRYVERDRVSPFTFMAMGRTFGGRKGVAKTLRCFLKLKDRGELGESRLLIKLGKLPFKTVQFGGKTRDDVEIIAEKVDFGTLAGLYGKADAFVYPSHGEGYGLEPLEAMATGACALVTNWSGMTDYIRDDVCIPLPYKLGNFPSPPYDGCGEMAFVDEDVLQEKMVWCYEHQEQVREMGRAASEYVCSEWRWDKAIRIAADALIEHAASIYS